MWEWVLLVLYSIYPLDFKVIVFYIWLISEIMKHINVSRRKLTENLRIFRWSLSNHQKHINNSNKMPKNLRNTKSKVFG